MKAIRDKTMSQLIREQWEATHKARRRAEERASEIRAKPLRDYRGTEANEDYWFAQNFAKQLDAEAGAHALGGERLRQLLNESERRDQIAEQKLGRDEATLMVVLDMLSKSPHVDTVDKISRRELRLQLEELLEEARS